VGAVCQNPGARRKNSSIDQFDC